MDDFLSHSNSFIENDELTVEKLRTYKGFENVSEEQAIQDITTIKAFARILYEKYKQENQKS